MTVQLLIKSLSTDETAITKEYFKLDNTLLYLPKFVVNVETYEELFSEVFHDGGSYHVETSSLICRPNQWTGFYMMGPPS